MLRLTKVLPRHPLGYIIAGRHVPITLFTSGLGGGQVEQHVRRHVVLRDAST